VGGKERGPVETGENLSPLTTSTKRGTVGERGEITEDERGRKRKRSRPRMGRMGGPKMFPSTKKLVREWEKKLSMKKKGGRF